MDKGQSSKPVEQIPDLLGVRAGSFNDIAWWRRRSEEKGKGKCLEEIAVDIGPFRCDLSCRVGLRGMLDNMGGMIVPPSQEDAPTNININLQDISRPIYLEQSN